MSSTPGVWLVLGPVGMLSVDQTPLSDGLKSLARLTLLVALPASATTRREVRDEYVNTQQPPASTAVEVRRLVRDDLLIEVEAVAVVTSFQPMTAPA